MKVQEITIHAGRTFNHPHESYSNLKPAISIRAFLEEGDDPETVIKDLQAKAEKLVEDHKQHMLKSLDDLYYLNEAQREMTSLESQIRTCQNRVEGLRKRLSPVQEELPLQEDLKGSDGLEEVHWEAAGRASGPRRIDGEILYEP